MHLTKRITRFTRYASLLLIAATTTAAYAQPDTEMQLLQSQLERLNERVKSIQEEKSEAADPFGQRVRSVGRQRAPVVKLDDNTLSIRFYDLSDIFSVAPQYPARMANDLSIADEDMFPISRGVGSLSGGGGFGGGGGGVFNIPPASGPAQQQATNLSLSAARVSVETLVNTIKLTVAPEQWDNQGGKASINVLGNTLLISATDSMHVQINDLLNLFREHWGKLKTISVQAYWIRSNPAEIRELLAGDGENRMVGLVDKAKWDQSFPKFNVENRVAYSASVNGHNGQTLNAVSGRQTMLVVDALPLYAVVAQRNELELQEGERPRADEFESDEHSVAGLYPIRRSIQEGAAIQLSPLATRGGNYVVLDLHTRVNERLPSADDARVAQVIARTKDGSEIAMELDTPNYISYRMSTTIRCPKNEIMLAGGMTYDAQQGQEQPNLYLFIQTRIHTIEEDQSDRKPD